MAWHAFSANDDPRLIKRLPVWALRARERGAKDQDFPITHPSLSKKMVQKKTSRFVALRVSPNWSRRRDETSCPLVEAVSMSSDEGGSSFARWVCGICADNLVDILCHILLFSDETYDWQGFLCERASI